MLKTHWRLVSLLERIGDNAIVILAFFAAYFYRDSLLSLIAPFTFASPKKLHALGKISDYFIVLGVSLPLFNAILSLSGAYRSMRFSSVLQLIRMASFSSLLVFLCVGSVLYLLKLDLSRSFVGVYCFLCGVGLLIERYSMLRLLRYWRIRGKNFRNLLIAGTGKQAREVYLEIMRQPELGVRVVGFVHMGSQGKSSVLKVGSSPAGGQEMIEKQSASFVYDLPARVVATKKTFEVALKKYAVDEVLFTEVSRNLAAIEDLAEIAVDEGIHVTLAADLFSLGIIKSDASYFGSLPLIHYQPAPGDSWALFTKRLVDMGISTLLLLLLAPLMLAVAFCIKLDSPGPIFFKQRRMGLNGRTFVLLKFRSMIKDAEKQLGELVSRNEMNGPVFKIRNDPRITRVGKWIRRLSIDELPQLINVLKGDMSLVGPRPPLPEEVSLYIRKHRRRLSMRPGLTCIWQTSGRNEIQDFETWASLDLEYIDNWSLKKDFELLLKTVPAVLSGFGAR